MASRTSRSGVPMITSPTPARSTAPVTVHTIVPGDSSVPSVRYHEAPRARMWATLASVSTFSTRAGVASPAPTISMSADRPVSRSSPGVPPSAASSWRPRRNGGAMRGNG